jgi:hypothetical protein
MLNQAGHFVTAPTGLSLEPGPGWRAERRASRAGIRQIHRCKAHASAGSAWRDSCPCTLRTPVPQQGEAGDMTFIVPLQALPTEERMSRKLSLATLALFAALLATPVMAQQPTGKDSTHAAATTSHKSSKKHHKSSTSKDTTKAATAKKDSTSKK